MRSENRKRFSGGGRRTGAWLNGDCFADKDSLPLPGSLINIFPIKIATITISGR